ncbi:MAG: SUMF1/EgtB/PvdO family nonheme iron enzyme, partial [Alphaproteobacteria bacterium]|nr:SUMF1/EgtB/PvdO family nonheme iron enzyme [Alphaproteobacteria bacterium]
MNRKADRRREHYRIKPVATAGAGILTALLLLAGASSAIWQLTRTTSEIEVVADIAWRDGVAWRARLSDRGEVELDVAQPAAEGETPLPRRIVTDISGHGSAITSVRFRDDGRILETVDQDGRVIETDIDRLAALMGAPSYQVLQRARQAAEIEIGRPYGERSITAASSAYGWMMAAISPATKSAKTVGEVFRDCDACPEMVVLPAGSYLMGSPESQGSDVERPQHEVTIAAPFAMGRYE